MKNYTINDIYMKRPASAFCHRWRDSFPIGTGVTGAMLYGGVSAEHIIIGRNDMWYGGVNASVPDVSKHIEKMRALSKKGRFDEANSLLYDALIDGGYATELANMRTLGCVKIELPCDGIYSRYNRVIHTDTSEAEVKYKVDEKSFVRRYTASRKRDVIAVELEADAKMDFHIESGFFNSFEGGKEEELRALDEASAKHFSEGDCYIYSSKSEGKYFGIVCRVVTDGVSVVGDGGIDVKNSKKTLLLIKAFSGETDRRAGEKSATEALLACPGNYAEIFSENLPEYQRLYKSADISLYNSDQFHSNEELMANARDDKLSAELTEKLWRFGRYLFISGTAIGGLPFALYGLWVGGYDCMYTHNVANENVQIIYWHTQNGGLSELNKSLVEYYFDRMNGYRENARKLFGCRGIFIGTYTTPVNSTVAWYVPVILHFNGVAGWLSQHFYRYYLYTKDEKFFEEKILPFMLETAQFYEDFYYTDDEGNLVLYPAVSPENSPKEYYDKSKPHSMPATENPTIELAILKELLTNLISESRKRPELKEKALVWEEMLGKIPSYRINKDGAIAEWVCESHSDAYDHRHISHLYPVFPGTEVNFRDNSELMPAFKKALELREKGSFCGWTFPHMGSAYARFGDRDKVFYCMNAFAKVCMLENFYTLCFDYRDMGMTNYECGSENKAPVQFDAIMGFTGLVQDMLLLTMPGTVKILPSCPGEYNEGSAKLFFCDGKVEINWNISKKECYGIITASRDTQFELYLPFTDKATKVSLKSGESYEYGQ